MKCVCGYEYVSMYDSKNNKVAIKGDEEFVHIYGTFLRESTGWEHNKVEVELYACPKCNTIQLTS